MKPVKPSKPSRPTRTPRPASPAKSTNPVRSNNQSKSTSPTRTTRPARSKSPARPTNPARPPRSPSKPVPARKTAEEALRLQVYLSKAGVASRRKGEELILAGRIQVNGQVVKLLGTKVLPGQDKIALDGTTIELVQERVTYLVNKPDSVLCTVRDPEKRAIVVDLVPKEIPVFPVGRLDYHSEGLIILTNDGDFAHFMMHPSHEVPKTYAVKVDQELTLKQIEILEKGVRIEGKPLKGFTIHYLEATARNFWYEVILTEGRNREIRRGFQAVGVRIRRLIRTHIGQLTIGNLKPGEYRILSKREMGALGYHP